MFYVVFFIVPVLWTACTAETSESYLLQTDSLPNDLNFMPSLANGHVGYTVFGDSIFMNGVYNGAGGNSKRARIPNWLNISTEVCDEFECYTDENETKYEMNLRDGYFNYRTKYSTLGLTLEQRTYPHRFYTRALVYELTATRHSNFSIPLFLKLSQHPGNQSSAFDFVVLNNGSNANGDYRTLRGRTQILEFESFQSQPHEIYVLFSSNAPQQLQLALGGLIELRYRFIITMDRNLTIARKEMDDILKLDFTAMLQRHAETWHNFWDENFSIEIVGDLELWRIVNAGIFYMSSSLPSLTTNQPNEPYYGLSPTGLARGNLDSDYQGHNFWDTEIWMLPIATQFNHDYAKILLDYRLNHLEEAKYNARAGGYKGARFPWESAFTGTEVTNPCCPEVAEQEIHISADIVFAMDRFFAQSVDLSWLCSKAWTIAVEVAEFLVSRSNCGKINQVCHFRHVMGPDEDHADVDDNVYTNAVAKKALDFAEWADSKCGNESTAELREKWSRLKDRLLILHDVNLNYHPQHKGYMINETVKQADTILLGYPLRFDDSTVHLNDLHYYANVTRESGPAMTWSMFAANYLNTVEGWRAHDYFERGYKSYVRPEFKVWSENPIGYDGSANFLTGIGGFLQALLSGYGGIDFERDGDRANIVLRVGRVPPNVERVIVKYIHFAGNKCTFAFTNGTSGINCIPIIGQRYELIQGRQRTLLANDFNVTITADDEPVYISVIV